MTYPVDTEAPLDKTLELEAIAKDHANALALCPPGLLKAYGASVSPLSDAVAAMAEVHRHHREWSVNKERRHAAEKQLLREEIAVLKKMLDEASGGR